MKPSIFDVYDADNPKHWLGAFGADGTGNATQLCPYGKPGDRLWVRETFRFKEFWPADGVDDWGVTIQYYADMAFRRRYQCDAPGDVGMWPGAAIRKYEGKRRPSIFMPRWASRITLEITEVRVERVQQISAHDAVCEGITPFFKVPGISHEECREIDIEGYRDLWDSINAKRGYGWEKNPWVWVIEFRIF